MARSSSVGVSAASASDPMRIFGCQMPASEMPAQAFQLEDLVVDTVRRPARGCAPRDRPKAMTRNSCADRAPAGAQDEQESQRRRSGEDDAERFVGVRRLEAPMRWKEYREDEERGSGGRQEPDRQQKLNRLTSASARHARHDGTPEEPGEERCRRRWSPRTTSAPEARSTGARSPLGFPRHFFLRRSRLSRTSRSRSSRSASSQSPTASTRLERNGLVA